MMEDGMVIPKWIPITGCTRGSNIYEMIHNGGAIAVNKNGSILFEFGSTGSECTYFRSAMKVWQAIIPLRCGAIDYFMFNDKELALIISSHEGCNQHIDVALSMLKKMGLDQSYLNCGTHTPYNQEAALKCAGKPVALQNNCSGKHCGMLAACLHNGWPLETYQDYDHPLQVAIRKEVLRCARLPEDTVLPYGVDGCGVPTYVLPLQTMAFMWARFGEESQEERRLLAAMAAYPEMIAGDGVFDTEISRVTKGSILSKRGGAALGCTKVGNDIAVVVKCGDGHMDSVPVITMRVLDKLGVLKEEVRDALKSFERTPQRNCSGKHIGDLVALF